MEVNQKELAKILGITDRRIRQLKEQFGLFENGMTEGAKSKKYILERCVPEYIQYKLDAEMPSGSSIVREKEQAEHEQIKKKISILKLRKLRRELHQAEDVEEFLTDMLMNFKNRVLSIPQKVAPLVLAEDDINAVINILEKEVFQALDELSEYDPLKIDKESSAMQGMEEDEADEEEGG